MEERINKIEEKLDKINGTQEQIYKEQKSFWNGWDLKTILLICTTIGGFLWNYAVNDANIDFINEKLHDVKESIVTIQKDINELYYRSGKAAK